MNPHDPESYRTPRLSYVFTGPDSADATCGDDWSLDDTETEALRMRQLFGDEVHGSFTIAGPVSDLLRWMERLGQPNPDGWPGWTSADEWDPKDDDLPPIGPDGVPIDCTPETCATTPSRHCCLNDYTDPHPAPVSPVDGERGVDVTALPEWAALVAAVDDDAGTVAAYRAAVTGRGSALVRAVRRAAADRGGERP